MQLYSSHVSFEFKNIHLYIDYEGLNTSIKNLQGNFKWYSNAEVVKYEKTLKALTGLIFMVLGLTILNYGTKLETAISNNLEQ